MEKEHSIEISQKKKKSYMFILYFLIMTLVYLSLVFLSKQVGRAEYEISYTKILFVSLIYTIALSLRGLRYSILCNLGIDDTTQQKHRKIISIFGVYLGWGLNAFMPGRIGELSRLYVADSYDGISKFRAFNAIILEKLFDLSSIAIIGLTSLTYLIFQNESNRNSENIAMIMGLGILIVILVFLLIIKSELFFPLFSRIPKIGSHLIEIVKTIKQQIYYLMKEKLVLGRVILFSLIIWILDTLVFVIVLFQITNEIPVVFAIFAALTGYYTFAFPILPNAAGQYELAVALIFEAFKYDYNYGFQAALLEHVIKAVVAVILGIMVMINMGISVVSLQKGISNSYNDVESL